MSEEEIANFQTREQKLAYDLISGRSRQEIVEDLVTSSEWREFNEDSEEVHVMEYIDDFEQKLLGGSRCLGKNKKFYKDTLKKYICYTQGREWLRKVYKQQIVSGLRRMSFCISVLILSLILVLIMGRNRWVELLGGLVGGVGAIVHIIWTLIGFKRWYKLRD